MFCPKCGREELGNATFCHGCGERLRWREPLQQESKPKSTWGSMWLGMLFGFIAFVVIVFALDWLNLLQGWDGWQSLLAASVVAGLLAGIIARRFWRGGLAAALPVAVGCAVLTVIGYRLSQGPSGGQFEELSAWSSFVEMLQRGGGTAALTGAIAGHLTDTITRWQNKGHKTGQIA